MLYFGGYSISLLPLHPKTQMGVGPCRSMLNVNSQYEANITIDKLNCSPSPKELAFIKFYEVCIWKWNNRPKVKAEEIKRMGPYRCTLICHGTLLICQQASFSAQGPHQCVHPC